jgi:hypothetical protein
MGIIENARRCVTEPDWVEAHAALTRLAREGAADAEEGRWLLCAWRSEAHVHVGCGSFSDYVERFLGHQPRTTREKLRVAQALEKLPELARTLESGALSWSSARELTRVAAPDTEAAWIDAALGKTLRQVEKLVANRSFGDGPAAPGTARPRPRVLRFEVAPETFALFREAMLALRRSSGGLNDDAILLSLARRVLASSSDEGRAGHRMSLAGGANDGSEEQLAGSESLPIGGDVVAMAECDEQHVGSRVLLAANENAGPHGATLALVASSEGDCALRDDDVRTAPNVMDAHVGVGKSW